MTLLSEANGFGPKEAGSTGTLGLSWDLYAAAILSAAVFFELLQWPLLPRSIDLHYHMAVANGFRLAGGYVTHAFWEFAPAGRPHLYPPLLHTVLLALRSAGLSTVDAARLVEVAAHPLTLFALWAAVRRLASPSAAFFAVLIWSSVHSAYAASFSFPAETLALTLGLAAFVAFEKRALAAAAIFLAMAFYSHALFSWVVFVAFVLHGVITRRPRAAAFVAASALLLASPLLMHELSHVTSFRFVRVAEDTRLEIDGTLAALAAAGCLLALRQKILPAAPLCFLAASIPLFFVYRTRFTGGHGLVGPVWLAALALDAAFRRLAGRRAAAARIFLAVSAVWIAFAGPVFKMEQGCFRFEWAGTTFARQLFNRLPDARTTGLYHEERIGEIVSAVRANSASDEIFWSDLRYAAALVSALSDRVTSSAALEEVRPEGSLDPVAAAKVAVFFRDNDGHEPAWATPLARRHGLERVGETAWAIVYRSPRTTPRVPFPRPSVRVSVLFALFGAAALTAVWDLSRVKKREAA